VGVASQLKKTEPQKFLWADEDVILVFDDFLGHAVPQERRKSGSRPVRPML
jgi:hypothetical protein